MNHSTEEETNEKTPLKQSDSRFGITCKTACKKLSPFLMVIGAGFLFSINAALIKLMPLPAGQYVITVASFSIPFTLLICFYCGVDVSPFTVSEKKIWFWGRVVIGGMAFGGKKLVLKHMNIGDALAIMYTAPIWAGCMARIILKEKYTIVSLIATVSGLVGIVLILKPTVLFPNFLDRGESSIPWAFVTLGMSFLAAASYVCFYCNRGNGFRIFDKSSDE